MTIPSLNRPTYGSSLTDPHAPKPQTTADQSAKLNTLRQYTQQATSRANFLQNFTHVDQNKLDVITTHMSVAVALLDMLINESAPNPPAPSAEPTPLDITLKAREAVDNLFRGKSEEKLLEIRQITDTVLSTLRKEGIV